MSDMEEDNPNVSFSMSSDFQGGRFVDGEFYYESQKKRKRQHTKEDAMLGVFGDDDGYVRERTQKSSFDPAMPVMFQKAADNTLPNNTTTTTTTTTATTTRTPIPSLADSVAFAPTATSLGQQPQKQQPFSRLSNANKKQGKNMSNQADWEQHTKGIGSKLLALMGHKDGHGLGARNQGITTALTTNLRGKNEGLGFRGREKNDIALAAEKAMRASRMRGTQIAEEVDQQQEQPQQPLQLRPSAWKKDTAKAVRSKRVYKTAKQHLRGDEEEDQSAQTNQQPVQTILDMRGPGVRVLTSFKGLNDQLSFEASAASSNLPELQHNLRMLVDMTECEIQQLDSRAVSQKDSVRHLLTERTSLETQVEAEKAQISRLQTIANSLRVITQSDGINDSTQAAQVCKVLQDLMTSYPQEYVNHNLHTVALAACLPFVSKLMATWEPLANPSAGVEVFAQWKRVLVVPKMKRMGGKWRNMDNNDSEDESEDEVSDRDACFRRLVNDCWLPHMRKAVFSWVPQKPEALQAVIAAWQNIVGKLAIEYVLMQYALPRLNQACDAWDPRTDPIPVHQWLHPWLPWLAPQSQQPQSGLSIAHDIVRRKLTAVLMHWHPSDPSAAVVLAPWKGVFSQRDMDQLLIQCVVPKLNVAVQSMAIDVGSQLSVEPLRWLFSWVDLIPIAIIVSILESSFFTKWHGVLIQWLHSAAASGTSSAVFQDMMAWLNAWQSQFPAVVTSHERIKIQFMQAHNAINISAHDGVPPPPVAPQSTPAAAQAQVKTAETTQRENGLTLERAKVLLKTGVKTIKDITTQWAEEYGVLFMPHGTKQHLGKPEYVFGEERVMFDRTQAYMWSEGTWVPIDTEDLLLLAELHATSNTNQNN